MSSENTRAEVLTGSVPAVFARYAIPEIAAMLALSSAGLIDAIFLGNYAGAEALAAVNLSVPLWSLVFGLGLMIAVGGSVVCGKLLGEQQLQAANEIFTKTVVAALTVSLFFSVVLGSLLIDWLVGALGATEPRLAVPLTTYVTIMLWFAPVLMLETVLFYFVRLDGQPVLAALALVLGAVVNIALDWLLIVRYGQGIFGAALATAAAGSVAALVLLPHFFGRRSRLKFRGSLTRWSGFGRACMNGASEFANEASIGVTTFLFNWVMVTRMGVEGVAALTIIDYLLFAGLMLSYAISDSLQPVVSQNFGARLEGRIMAFLRIASSVIVLLSLMMIALILFVPEALAGAFLDEGDEETAAIAVRFLTYLWPAFLFNGLNILISGYLTSMQKPVQSAFIAFSRSFALPAGLLLLLPIWLGDTGIYLTLPLAEAFTFVLSLTFFVQNMPARLVRR
jgi:putative MATE family efflux protein